MIAGNAPSQAKETFVHTSYEILENSMKNAKQIYRSQSD
jgi:hypothetical protein